uniref:Tpr protein K n=1 Tax=Treponema pallidum TaxID=160 RepID=Q9L8T4_TREPL|nr:tpr protein K [Treponema pallidum]
MIDPSATSRYGSPRLVSNGFRHRRKVVYQRVGHRRFSLIFFFVVVLGRSPRLWAQVSFTPDIEGYAELAWGIASDGGAQPLKHGFKTTTDFKIVFPIVAKKDFKYRGEGNVYAEINVKALKLSLESNGGAKFDTKGSAKTIEATLHCYGAYLTIGKNPDFKSTFAVLWEPWTANGDYKSKGDKPVYEPGFEGAGGKLGYKQTDIAGTGLTFDIAFKFASNTDWEGKSNTGAPAAGVTPSKYGLGGDILFGWERTREDGVQEYIKVELTGNSTLSGDYARAAAAAAAAADDILWDVGAKVSMKLWGLCALAATDVGHKKENAANVNGTVGADALLTLGYRWFSAGGYFASKASNVFEGVFLARNIAMREHDCAAYIKLETKGSDPDTSFPEGLDLGVDVRTYMPVHWKALPAAAAIYFPVYGKVWGSYRHDMGEYGWVKVYANLYGGTNKKNDAAPTKWSKEYCGYYECGVVVSPLEKVEIRLSWEQGKLQENSNVVIEKNVTERCQFVGACRLIW